jgi:aminoglycoside phosphotransferase (APT) family kinase protein
MTRVHLVDWRALGFEHLDRAKHGSPGSEQLRNYFDHYRGWALDGSRHPTLEAAWDWLAAHWPHDDQHIDLTWGDARPGNVMFRDQQVVAVFDWEMAALCNAESDLGWWIYMQRFHTEGMATPLLDGLLDRDEIVAFWEERVGRSAKHVDFYEMLGGFHFSLIMVMMGRNMLRLTPGQFPEDFGLTNPGVQVLARMMEAV